MSGGESLVDKLGIKLGGNLSLKKNIKPLE